MTSPFDIHQYLEEACYAFAQKLQVEVHEMVNLLGIQDATKSTELPKYVRVTLHKIKRQAGIFGLPLASGIARVAEPYAASQTQFDYTTLRHLNASLDMMRNLLDGQEKFNEPALSDLQTSSPAMQDSL